MSFTPEARRAAVATAVAAVVSVGIGGSGLGPPWPVIAIVGTIVVTAELALTRIVVPPTPTPLRQQAPLAPLSPTPEPTTAAIQPATWYENETATQSDLPAATASPTPAMAPIASYVATSEGRLPQCPHCGRHDITGHQAGDAYAFECATCKYSWAWMTGSPWPRTMALPNPRVRP